MPVFEFPSDSLLIAHFTLPTVQTWGSVHDREFKERVRLASGLTATVEEQLQPFVFVIRCTVARSRERYRRQIPDVENIPKLIVDAFTGVLYPDDNIRYVQGVQVEAEFGEEPDERTEVWIFGKQNSRVKE